MIKRITSTRLTRRIAGTALAAAMIAVGVTGAQTLANGGEEGAGDPPTPLGVDAALEAPGPVEGGENNLIQTSGATFDETVLTKFIPAVAFTPGQGDPAAGGLDAAQANGSGCLAPLTTASSGPDSELRAPLELPDGARIKQITFSGVDNAFADIFVSLAREEFTGSLSIAPNPPTYVREDEVVDVFSTSGASVALKVISGADNLGELVGTPSPGGPFIEFSHRFHSLTVILNNAAGNNHLLCGVQVDYQVAKSSAGPGTVFHPIDPVRVFDSRQASFPAAGLLAPNTSKVVSVANGFDSAGVAIPAQANAVPEGATAITYNLTAAGATGPNFVSVTAGDSASFTASSLNYNAGSNVANAATVTIAADRTIKLWGGDNTGSTNVIIDITGYYAPAPPLPNMAS